MNRAPASAPGGASPIVVAPGAPAGPPGPPQRLTGRVVAALLGIYIAAMMAGLNNRVGALALADVRGALGHALDDASWLGTAYSAGELIAMPFAAWFAVTVSLRRFHLWLLAITATLAVLLPFMRNLELMLALRFVQGISSGALIPLLMMAALKYLPLSIRLHGLTLFAMTATFSPNLAVWVAAQWTDTLFDWRWVYWQFVPAALLAGLLVGWGLPREPVIHARFGQANWPGAALVVPALGLIVVALDQGGRLDWFNSPLIAACLLVGLALFVCYLLTEWFHPAPFLKLQMLQRRNLGLGFTVFGGLLVVMLSGSLLPSSYLTQVQGYRALQNAPLGLIVALPQLVLGPLVALLLYQRQVDARKVFALGLVLLALACFSAARLDAAWIWEQFVPAQVLQAFGQAMVVVPLLFLATSVVQPPEGPFVGGMVNIVRVFSTLAGSAAINQLLHVRGRFHAQMLLDHAALVGPALPQPPDPNVLAGAIQTQSLVLATADGFRVLGLLALVLVPLVLLLTYIPAPDPRAAPPRAAPLPASPIPG